MAFELQNVTEKHSLNLFRLLEKRDKVANISHREMPSWEKHHVFVSDYCKGFASSPYKLWCAILINGVFVGAGYLTRENEIGIGLLKASTGKGYGKKALDKMIEMAGPGRYLANIAPDNKGSQAFFKREGFEIIRYTYEKTC